MTRLAQRQAARKDPGTVATEALKWGEPVLELALTLIDDGRLYYRGVEAVPLKTATLEEAAALLWGGPLESFGSPCQRPDPAAQGSCASGTVSNDVAARGSAGSGGVRSRPGWRAPNRAAHPQAADRAGPWPGRLLRAGRRTTRTRLALFGCGPTPDRAGARVMRGSREQDPTK